MLRSRTTRIPFKFRIQHLFLILALISTALYFFTGPSPPKAIPTVTYCPYSTSSSYHPTVLFQADGLEDPVGDERTYFIDEAFLPFDAERLLFNLSYPVDIAGQAPPEPVAKVADPISIPRGQQLCPLFVVPSSPRVLLSRKCRYSSIIIGIATTPARLQYHLPTWSLSLPASPKPIAVEEERGETQTKHQPMLYVVIETIKKGDTEGKETLNDAKEEGRNLGILMKVKEVVGGDRVERRYFGLVKDLWQAAEERERKGGDKVEWFVFADDDTFFPDFAAVTRTLREHSSASDWLIGSLSESTKQVAQWGHIAYGGAGIFVSRSLMKKMNAPGAWEDCLNEFGNAFGGDAMVSLCAARVSKTPIERLLTIDSTLHQLDIRGDSTGFFQSGLRFSSFHHWESWYTFFPSWSETAGDARDGVLLVGKAAGLLGGDNWGRRYLFDGGNIVVHLGYSIVVESSPLTIQDLGQSEKTWWDFDTFYPTRRSREEGVEKRTYYLARVQTIAKGVVKLVHKNREGDRVDLIWDGRRDQ